MGLEDDFGLALNDIKNSISSKRLNYLKSVLSSGSDSVGARKGSNIFSGTPDRDGHNSNWSESSGSRGIGTFSADFGGDTKSEDGSNTCGRREDEEVNKNQSLTLPFVAPEEEDEARRRVVGVKKGGQFHLSSSAVQKQLQGINPRMKALCSHLYPVCRKIMAKTPPLPPRPSNTPTEAAGDGHHQDLDVKSVSELVEREKSTCWRDSPYQEIIGKISETRLQKDFARVPLSVLLSLEKNENKKKKKKKAGVCDYSHPISNPLYKSYNPQGYKKTEDEMAREHIEIIGRDFNEWLISLEGDHPVQLDLQLLTRILRDEMQLPDEKSKRQGQAYVHSLLKINFP